MAQYMLLAIFIIGATLFLMVSSLSVRNLISGIPIEIIQLRNCKYISCDATFPKSFSCCLLFGGGAGYIEMHFIGFSAKCRSTHNILL